jgi:putative flippase GtrA
MISTRILESEAGRFLLVGGTTVLIDFVIYLFLLFIVGLETEISKGIGFTGGALFAYFANREFTFNSPTKGFFVFSLFWILYITTLTVNVSINEFSLSVFGVESFGIGLSLFIATGFSALLNYIGMKYMIFRSW